MKNISSNYKENIKLFGRQIDSKITYELDGEEIELGAEELNSVTPHYESSILKSVMKQLDVDSNVEIPIGSVINYQFGVKTGNAYEYIDYGNYVVYKSEKQEDTKSWKLTCYDKMLYSMVPYESLDVTYPITVKNLLVAICEYMGVEFANENDNFVNSDKQITSELYLDGDGNSLDYTFRDVLDELAQVTASVICINDEDKLEIRYVNNTGEYETVEGTELSLENVDDKKDIEYTLKGNTSQNGTPTPSTPIEVETTTGSQIIDVLGTNYVAVNDIEETTVNGITYSIKDGVVSLNGTATNSISIYTTEKYNLSAGTYTFSYEKLEGSYTGIIGKYLRLGTTMIYDGGQLNSTQTRTINSYIGCVTSLYIAKDVVCNNLKFYLKLNKGSSVLPYEPYKGKSYEINLGKNLLNIQGIVKGRLDNGVLAYQNNVTNLILNDNSFSFTTNANYRGVTTDYISISEGNYTISSDILNSEYGIKVACYDSSKVWLQDASFSGLASEKVRYITIPSGTYYIRIYFSLNNAGTIIITNSQLEKGSEATSYSSYKTPIELCKIGDYQDKIYKGSGINLLDTSTAEKGYYYVTNSISASSNWYIQQVSVKPSTNYYLSGNNRNNTNAYVVLLDSSKNIISSLGSYPSVHSITTTDNTAYIGVSIADYEGTADMNTIMINEGTTALIYEPYNSKGKWLLHKEIGKVVLNGSESWAKSGSTAIDRFYIELESGVLSNYNNQVAVSNRFYYSTSAIVGTMQLGSYQNNTRLFLDYSTYGTTTLSQFKTWLNSNNTIAYYVLTTPTTTEITDIDLLNQLNSVELLEGLNNISVISSNLSSPLNLTYLSELDMIDEEYLKDVNVNFGEKFGPVNAVVLSRSAESDNIYQRDEASVESNGICEVKIKDNQILNGNNRDEFLPEIFNKLNGLEYYLTDFTSTGITFYDLLDRYKVKVEDNYYKTIMFNDEIDVTQGLEEQVYANELEESETDYTKSDKTDRRINQAYIIVDKQNQQINSVVQSINTLQNAVNAQGEQVEAIGTRVTQEIDNITASVSNIQDTIDNGVNLVKTTSVIINDEGLSVSTDTSKIKTNMANNSFEIKDNGGSTLAYFGYDEQENISKAEMNNLTVTNYFVAGYHRTEKTEADGEHRTGVFYIGG